MSDYKTPGQLIEALLAERGWTQRLLAVVLDMSESTTNKLISGKQAVSAEIALLLEEVFETPAERFLSLQKDFDLARARLVSRPDPGRATRAEVFRGLPVAEMIKRRWIDATDIKDIQSVEASLAKFFRVSTIGDIEFLPHAAKKTAVGGETTPAQLAWLYRVRQIAGEMMVGQFSPFGVRRAIEQLKLLVLSVEEARKVPRVLAEAGIRFVIVESLPGAKIDGVCFWLDDQSPVIGMSFRHDRIDNFWFVLRHELEHVLRGHGKELIEIDSELEGSRAGVGNDISEQERQANAAAAEFCIPAKTLDAFIARKAPFFAERDIQSLAAALKIHPGLVAGQLQHRTGRYDRFRDHLVKVRSIIAPGASVDGWGDVAPVGI
ncbi:HTH-type transcriptional regulator/antitoxin HigA [Paraburkholderia eburnea]|uniref:HTH-type transcriptional regulator/antitoxin HigA n=1 Tax=Paraburkholderia eburnea TaxID=1189126 RepID=A0A2S4MIZ4_9BURK|nr:HigA family addiction module antitoxin [Paraburkholderia eburnea]POR54579.1 HTH-type transcriptional regulator/antitoxin HigA [Paraburkholderia eburnea]PRZ24821.1 HTH-type transcriptional regulator/antitoxin HigA [Paraburkholderia eburnea]